MQLRLNMLRIVLLVVLFTTLVLGLVCYLSGDAALKLARLIYGTTLSELTPQVNYLLKMMGAYLITLGVLNVLAVANPLKYRAIVYADALMAVLRALQRVIFANSIQESFGLSMTRIYLNAGTMLVGAIVLGLLMRSVSKAADRQTAV